MDKTISSSSYDVIVIKQPNGSYKSTPFQVAFSSNLLKNLTKKNQVQLWVNQEQIGIPLRLDLKTGRIAFIKKYEKRNILSDSSDFSDDDISQTSRDKFVNKNLSITQKKQRPEDYKNQKVPKPFWQFAWLFQTKQTDQQPVEKINKQSTKSQYHSIETREQSQQQTLQKIEQQIYQGEQSSKQPMFHLSLCKSSLKKKQKREDIIKEFYKRRVPYQEFIKDPNKYLSDSELIVKIDDSLYTWDLGVSILICRLAYGKQLSPQLIDDMIRNKFTKSKFITYFTGENLTKIDISDTNNKKEFTINSNTNNFPVKVVIRHRKNPDSQTIEKMKLKQGSNKAKFILNTGTSKEEIHMRIFLWNYNEKLIVSDIDGTITKSDIAGQLWSNYIHSGVTKLFSQTYKRGYKLVYLTARAIGQYNQTIKFLQTAEEDGVKLPEGPLLMSPDGFLKSFTREIIDKTPDFLKTKILASLNQIFPHSRKPLYCGFGNRQTDSVAYLRINIDPDKIFFITPKSIISKQSSTDFTITYVQMLEKIDDYFPFYIKEVEQQLSNADDNLNRSKNSADIEEEYFSAEKRKKSLSESSEPGLGSELQNLQMSQRIKRSSPDENQGVDTEYHIPFKHSRSKSVEHNNEYMNDKMQDLQALLKETLRQGNQSQSNKQIEVNSPKLCALNQQKSSQPQPQSQQIEINLSQKNSSKSQNSLQNKSGSGSSKKISTQQRQQKQIENSAQSSPTKLKSHDKQKIE